MPKDLNLIQPPHTQTGHTGTSDNTFPIVCIGASAGGLRAFIDFFDAIPAETNMAFVLVQHLAPDHQSELVELLQSHTSMQVLQVVDGLQVQPNHVYIIPPGKSMSIQAGALSLAPPVQPHGQRTSIDDFLRSLASDIGERAICIILSGTGSDGMLGAKSIKEHGGVVMVQSTDEAEYDGMPRSALSTSLVDVVAPVADLAHKLVEVHQHADLIQVAPQPEMLSDENLRTLQQILAQLHNKTSHDFSPYKRSTILRRIQRRMQVRGTNRLPDYLALLRSDEREADALFKDFLISVTNFFRDPEAFSALKKRIATRLLANLRQDENIRIWVPGCATGEEAYSLAMLFFETSAQPLPIQIFATDLDEDALAFARNALYPPTIVADVAPKRLERFFTHEDAGFRIKDEIARAVLFAPHNLLKDPPYSHLDLISCRNLLIYLERNIQPHVFDLFHYALRSDGLLFLGNSESADGVGSRFRVLDKTHRIFQRRSGASRLTQMPPALSKDSTPLAGVKRTNDERDPRPLSALHRQMMLERYAPPSLMVNDDYDICYLFGDAGRYLQPEEGEPTHNLLQNVGGELRIELRTALFQIFQTDQQPEPRKVTLNIGGTVETILLQFEKIDHPDQDDNLVLVVFEPAPQLDEERPAADSPTGSADKLVIEKLEAELQRTRRHMQTVVNQYEQTNEELKSSNEELQSTNEELRSLMEELETSKEELQSTNEELHTVNRELTAKMSELARANSDLQNLIDSTQIATLFLDRDLCLKRYTPQATTLFNIIPSDLDRPFEHISHQFEDVDLAEQAQTVLDQLNTVERQIKDKLNQWFAMRMSPYQAVDDKIEGVVCTFINITDSKQYQQVIVTRERQQAAVANLGQWALTGPSMQELMERTVRLVSDTIDVPLCKVLELQPPGDALLLRAGVGWKEGYVGKASVGTDSDSQAGYTLTSNGPVIVEDLATEARFSGPHLLIEHGVVSGISVVISGRSEPYGVLGAHTRELRRFSAEDANFLQTVANVVAAAIERQSTENALRDSTALFEAVLQNIPAGVIVAEAPSGRLILGNERVDQIWRHSFLPANDIEGYRVYKGYHPDGRPYQPEEWPLARATTSGETVQGEEIDFERGDGTSGTMLVSAAPVYAEEGDVAAGVTIFSDITERKQSDDALRKSTQRLQLAIDAIGGGVYEHSVPLDQSVYHSPRWAEILGYSTSELPDYGQFMTWLVAQVHPGDVRRLETAYRRFIDGVSPTYEVEIRLRHKEGYWVWVRGFSRALERDKNNGRVTRLVGLMYDITARKQAEESLRDLTETLEQRVIERTAQIRALVSALTLAEQRERHRVAGILHDDLQQLLFAVQFQFRLLENALATQDIAASEEVLSRMEEIIARGLTVARTLSIDLSPPILRSEGLIEAVRWLGAQMEELHGLHVTVTTDAPIAIASEAMRVLLFQLVRELLFNVVKHAGVDEAQVGLQQAEETISIWVEDQGAGFDLTMISASGGNGQRGIGLFHMRERLRLFSGELEINTKVGHGTRATILVPTHAVTSDMSSAEVK